MTTFRSKQLLVAAAIIFLGVLAVGSGPSAQPTPLDEPQAGAAVSPMNDPDEFAWQVFAKISRPAGNGSNDVVWETWALQTDVYADPNDKPRWPDGSHRPLVLSPSFQQSFRVDSQEDDGESTADEASDEAPSEEVHMNRPTFDFIVANHLWYRQGQRAMFYRDAAFNFPTSSIEVKAKWKRITEAEKPRFHWQVGKDGKLYGLTGLHLMTKDIPNWFWATFEQEDNPQRGKVLPVHDSFGLAPGGGRPSAALLRLFHAAGLGKEWTHYRLDGSQTEYTDPTGRPILLGSSVIEKHFVKTASCMTCHALSTVNAQGFELPFFRPDGQSYNGVPNPALFYTPGTNHRLYEQRDFVWSLSLAKNRSTGKSTL